ncbi:MAG: methyltransferase domain-containing protein [Fimbriimonadales bacterium]|jgi:SAM-dependent methyltransferase|nr:methyltransferase domain-containing protein [Armatimonadota bacterium]MCX7687873.1 methyltransferase domain-containing protein [Fimbriimonadales bacterium]GBC89497.1 putative S-adenosylmethionine-dependent methyltransferase [bacterium HR14]CUU05324.1 Ubiquinone/menaquinone biosynthesis C-methylase UbiE [Armatimonadetes bacterium GBS]
MEANKFSWDYAQLERILRAYGDTRPVESVIAQYEYEREMARRLLQASREERQALYKEVYNNLYQNFPEHPGLTNRHSPQRKQKIRRLVEHIQPFLSPESVFVEIGSGDCLLAYEVAPMVKRVYALEVSSEKVAPQPPEVRNFTLVLFDGFEIPLDNSSVTVAFSDQVLEHLHPEDALEHLREVYRTLTQGGYYICRVPHRFTGPHDISKYFTEQASGLHIKEYTYYELAVLFRKAGFSRLNALIKGRCVPARWMGALERLLAPLPHRVRKRVAERLRVFRTVALVGQK